MKNRQQRFIFLVLWLFLLTGYSGFRSFPAVTSPTPGADFSGTSTPAAVLSSTSTSPVDLIDFTGRWIAYNVISLDPDRAVKQKPGMRLKIAENEFQVDAQVCGTPKYEISETNLIDFLGVKQPPASSLEVNEYKIQRLSTGCTHLTPSVLAKTNQRTLAAVIGSDVLYFEPDFSLTVGSMSIESDLLSETNQNPLYEIHAQIPVLKDAADQAFNDLIRQVIMSEADGFRHRFDDWNIPPEMDGYQSFMWIGYDVPLLTETLISIRFSVDYYMAGAAHPNHYFKVLNFDLQKGQEILFSTVFKDPSTALQQLSSLCKTNLDKPDFPLFPEGLEPKLENFENWNLTPDGLRISFDPIQVAPYAAGPQQVLIPYDEIRPLIKTDSAVGAFIAY